MNTGKKLVVLYTRIDGVEKLEVAGFPAESADSEQMAQKRAGLEINREFHEALGLKVGGVR